MIFRILITLCTVSLLSIGFPYEEQKEGNSKPEDPVYYDVPNIINGVQYIEFEEPIFISVKA